MKFKIVQYIQKKINFQITEIRYLVLIREKEN